MIIASTKRLRHEKKNIFFHFCLVLFLLVLWRFFFPFDFVLFRKIRQYSSWGGGAGGGARGEGGGAARAGREEEMLQKAIPKLVLKKNH